MLQNNLVQVKNKEIYTTSKIIADNLEVKHLDLLRTIKSTFVKKGAEDNSVFSQKKYSQKIVETEFTNRMNKKYKGYLLNEQAFIKLVMQLGRYEKADKIQNQFIESFSMMKEALNRQSNNSWLNARDKVKENRKLETDVIKELTEYAEKEAGRPMSYPLYSTYSKMTNKYLQFIVDVSGGKPIRDLATIDDLGFILIVNDRCKRAIQDGMARKLPYQEIYKYAKDEVIKLVDSLNFKPKALT